MSSIKSDLSKSVRNRRNKRSRLYARDGGRCFWCSRKLDMRDMTLDHLVPRSQGGRNTDDNLVVSCKPCNEDRDRTPAEVYLFKRLQQGANA